MAKGRRQVAVKLPCFDLSHGMDHAMLDREQPVRTDEARVRKLPPLEVGIVEGNGKVVRPMTCGDLAEDEVVAGEIDENQRR